METWSVHQLSKKAEKTLGTQRATNLAAYAGRLVGRGLPVVFSLRHLAKIIGVQYSFLHDTVNRRRERANYRMFRISKRSGGFRFIHAVGKNLALVHEFINRSILQCIKPHPSSFAFHNSGGIRACAERHIGGRWLLQFDLAHFFYSINEIDVCNIFKSLGYTPLLSFELARLCTTTHLPKGVSSQLFWPDNPDDRFAKKPYPRRKMIGVLPQGAATSPMLSNLAAEQLDNRLDQFCLHFGLVYTRYADDISISAASIPRHLSTGKIRGDVIHIIRRSGFKENCNKTRIAGPGSKKQVLGLLVDGGNVRLSKETRNRIDRHLFACEKFGITAVATHEGFDSAFGFHNHLKGLIAYAKDVDKTKWASFAARLKSIPSPLE